MSLFFSTLVLRRIFFREQEHCQAALIFVIQTETNKM